MFLLEQIPPLVVVVVGDNNYDKSLLQTPEELISLDCWVTLKVHWWEFLIYAVCSKDSLSAKES